MENTNPTRYLESLIRNGELNLARAVANELITSEPDNPYYYRKLIEVEEKSSRHHVVLMIYPELVRRAKDIHDTYKWFKKLYAVCDFDVIINHFNGVWDDFPKDQLHNPPYCGVWLMALKSALKWRALDDFGRFSKDHIECLRHEDPVYYTMMAVYDLLRHEPQKALDVLDEGRSLIKNTVDYEQLMALSYYAASDLKSAEAHFWKALKMGSSIAFPYLLELCPENDELYQVLVPKPISADV